MSYEELSCRVVKVRKDHVCEWCAGPILTGESSVYRVYKSWGDLGSGWLHPECFAAMNKTKFDTDDGWMPGDFKRGETGP